MSKRRYRFARQGMQLRHLRTSQSDMTMNYDMGPAYHQKEVAVCPPAAPIFLDIPIYIPEVERDGCLTHAFTPGWTQNYELFSRADMHAFVFTGARDLWLLPGSSVSGRSFIYAPTPLDTYRPGCPLEVSWGTVGRYDNLELVVENRSRARNGGKGEFIGRIVCKAWPTA